MLVIGRFAAHRYKCTRAGVGDWPGQGATLGKDLV
jgi:hypothetical protein